MKPEPTLLLVPGLRGHVEDHWQTLLARKIPGSRTVPPLEQDQLSREARVAALDAALQAIDGPVVLVAHSAGALTTVHWAAWAQRRTPQIASALLAVPADLETPLPPGYPSPEALQANGWLPVPRRPLPFPVVVAASTNDPLARLDRVAAFARDWGARLVDVGPVGHLNPAAGFGEWRQGEALVRDLLAAARVVVDDRRASAPRA